MCLCTLCADRFLRLVDDSDVFLAYCESRQLGRTELASGSHRAETVSRWIAAVSALPEESRDRIEWEQAAVSELSTPDGVAHLLAACGPEPPPDTVPDGGPLALWVLLHRPDLFREVYFHHEHLAPDVWHAARAKPGLLLRDQADIQARLSETLRPLFRGHGCAGSPCEVETHRLPDAVCFVARLTGRLQIAERLTGGMGRMRQYLSAVLCVCFCYYPHDGTVLLQAPPSSVERIRSLFACFGQAALGAEVECPAAAFALDKLKHPFHPLPDGGDMEAVRVKALHLRYLERAGRSTLKLDTLAGDGPSAIDDLLSAHVNADALAELRVAYAELLIRLRVGGRHKEYLARLWPDRCDVGRGPVGDRFLACLRRWGLLA